MAAPSNKPVGYQVSVIVLALIVVILGTVIYMQVKQDREKQATYTKSEKDRQGVEQALKKRDEEFEDFAKLTGNGTAASDYGLGDDNITKVRGASLADIDKADVPAERTYKAAINKLVQQSSDLKQDREKIRVDLEALQKNLLDLQRQYDVQVKQNNDGRVRAEGDLSVSIKNKDEEVRAKQKVIDELRQSVARFKIA